MDGLFADLAKLGLKRASGFSWCWKFSYEGKNVDILFPEENRLSTTIAATVPEGASFINEENEIELNEPESGNCDPDPVY